MQPFVLALVAALATAGVATASVTDLDHDGANNLSEVASSGLRAADDHDNDGVRDGDDEDDDNDDILDSDDASPEDHDNDGEDDAEDEDDDLDDEDEIEVEEEEED